MTICVTGRFVILDVVDGNVNDGVVVGRPAMSDDDQMKPHRMKREMSVAVMVSDCLENLGMV